MSEADKIKHIQKGVAEDAFQLLLLKSPTTVQEVVSLCQALQDARNTRVQLTTPTSPATQPPFSGINMDDLRAIIRQIFREELMRIPVAPSTDTALPPSAPALQTIVRREVSSALTANVSDQPRPTYADVVRQSSTVGSHPPQFPDQDTVAAIYEPRSTPYRVPPFPFQQRVETRTCYYCGIRGHIARNCRKRRRAMTQFDNYGMPPPPFDAYRYRYLYYDQRSEPRDTSGNEDPPQNWRRRSPSLVHVGHVGRLPVTAPTLRHARKTNSRGPGRADRDFFSVTELLPGTLSLSLLTNQPSLLLLILVLLLR